MEGEDVVLARSASFSKTVFFIGRFSWNRNLTVSLAGFVIALSSAVCAQNSSSSQVDCNDPLYSTTSLFRATPDSTARPAVSSPRWTGNTTSGSDTGSQRNSDSQQVYIDQAGSDSRRRATSANRSETLFPPDPITDFQRLVRSSTGEMLPIFGRDLFQQAPSTFAPADQIPVTADYIVGPGDEVLVRLWGPESFNSQLTVDPSGSIYIPKVGAIHVAGLRSDELQKQISAEVNHTFRNYRISVSLGQLRSIQIYVVGEARRPGTYTISALSTVLNALFVSGGPNVQGSLRHIQIRHEGKPPSDFDLYDLVQRGDKTKDIRLQQGDTIFIPQTLKSILLPFNLGRLVQDQDASQNLEIQPGDVVTILSQADIPVSIDEQTKFVPLEGEFASAGVYSVHPGEDLESLVLRAGGLTSKAYLYGSSFLRESARVFQQQRLNEYISTLSADMERSAAARAASSSTGILDPNALAEQRSLVSQLRQLRATGRVVLEFRPTSIAVHSIPKIPLENGDVFRIPSRPNTVSVVGAVYGQNVFLFDSNRRLEDYVDLAGKPNRIADRKHAFIIRADGSIFSRERTQGVLCKGAGE